MVDFLNLGVFIMYTSQIQNPSLFLRMVADKVMIYGSLLVAEFSERVFIFKRDEDSESLKIFSPTGEEVSEELIYVLEKNAEQFIPTKVGTDKWAITHLSDRRLTQAFVILFGELLTFKSEKEAVSFIDRFKVVFRD